jgi:hypothetical protein
MTRSQRRGGYPVAIARNAANPVLFFGLPDDRTIVVGSSVEL